MRLFYYVTNSLNSVLGLKLRVSSSRKGKLEIYAGWVEVERDGGIGGCIGSN
jgi:hypothetical protein